jgi:hypothetical protein
VRHLIAAAPAETGVRRRRAGGMGQEGCARSAIPDRSAARHLPAIWVLVGPIPGLSRLPIPSVPQEVTVCRTVDEVVTARRVPLSGVFRLWLSGGEGSEGVFDEFMAAEGSARGP